MAIRQLVNVYVVRGGRDKDNKKMGLKQPGAYLVERVNGVKKHMLVKDPKITFRMTKREHEAKYASPAPLAVPLEHTEEVEAPNWYLLQRIADELPEWKDFYEDCKNTSNFTAMKKIHHDPRLHGSDVDVADHLISRYMQQYAAELDVTSPLTKAFFDIEVDSINLEGFPDAESAMAPINLIGLYDETKGTLFQFALRNPKNKSLVKFEAERLTEYHAHILKRFGVPIDLRFYGSEEDLLAGFFAALNDECDPDVLCCWNMPFDAQTLIGRIKRLGKDPAEFMCPKGMEYKYVDYHKDERAKDFSERKDVMTVASRTMWLDQMIQYAVIRKSMQRKDSYSLDAILAEELGMSKDEVVGGHKRFAYIDYFRFCEYNAMDVMGLHLLERKNGDVDLLQQVGIMTETRITKAMTKTICLRNMAARFFREQGFALSNNRNQKYDGYKNEPDPALPGSVDVKEKFRGAYVADPMLLDRTGIPLLGRPSDRVFEKVCDLDLASLYPSIIMAFNIDGSTQVGKLIIPDPPAAAVEGRLPYLSDPEVEVLRLDAGDAFVDSLQARDLLATGRKWFGLPDITEILEEIES